MSSFTIGYNTPVEEAFETLSKWKEYRRDQPTSRYDFQYCKEERILDATELLYQLALLLIDPQEEGFVRHEGEIRLFTHSRDHVGLAADCRNGFTASFFASAMNRGTVEFGLFREGCGGMVTDTPLCKEAGVWVDTVEEAYRFVRRTAGLRDRRIS